MRSISVIITCYRYGRYLPQCVESVLAQTGVELQALIIDDDSPDDTPAVAEALAATDARLTFRGHQPNKGHIAVYNEGLAWAEGDLCMLMSADDWLAPGALARAADVLETHPEVGLVCGGAVTYVEGQAQPPPPAVAGPGQWQVIPGQQWIADACRLAHVPVFAPEAVMRTATLRRVGEFDPALPHSGDLHLWLRFGLFGAVVKVHGAFQAYYRWHSANLSRTLSTSQLHELRHRRDAFEAFFGEHRADLPNFNQLRQAATRRLAREALLAAASLPAGSPPSAAEPLARFAFQTYPAAALTPEYWGWQVRRRLGPGALPAMRRVARRFFRL